MFGEYLCAQSWMFPCWRSLFVLFICMQQSGCWLCWSLQVAGIRSLVIRLRANWVAALRMVCWRLSQNYPWIIPQNYAIPVRQALSIDRTGKRENVGRRSSVCVCVCVCVCVLGGFGWSSVGVCVIERVFLCVCVCSVMILAVLVHWGNGAC